ncbi:MAG TPA: hypothetical protein VHS27_18775 [Gaiellales bacterium]|nr:hypothetical protein [Gaiellales bacterium]
MFIGWRIAREQDSGAAHTIHIANRRAIVIRMGVDEAPPQAAR